MVAAAPSVRAADFGSTKDTYATYAPYNWSGVLFGINVGGANMNSELSQQFPQFNVFGINDGLVLDTLGADRSIQGKSSDQGVIGGFQLGVQKQLGQVVVGGEINFNGADLTSSGRCWKAGRGFDFAGGPQSDFNYNANVECSTSMDWALDAVGKIGYAYDRWMPYLTVGYAIVGATHTNTFSYSDRLGLDGASALKNSAKFTQTSNETLHGLTYGLGLDYAMTDSFVVGAEYKRYDLSADGGGILGMSDRDFDANIFRIKANIKVN